MKEGVVFFGSALAIVIALNVAGHMMRNNAPTSDSVLQATTINFQDEVLKSKLPVLVDFWAPWCGPCRHMGPIVEEFGKEYKEQIKVAKVNVDENQILAHQYKIQGIPALCFFRNGELVERIEGAVPKEDLVAALQKVQAMH